MKTERIYLRTTPKEKKMIEDKARKKGTTMTALILNSVEKNITVKLDTSDYRDLVIQFRRIGNNINNIIKDIRFSKYFTSKDMLDIQKNLERLEEIMQDERKNIYKTRSRLEKMKPTDLVKHLGKEKMEIPKYLIYEEIEDHIIFELGLLIDIINKSEIDDSYITFIHYFIKGFIPREFDYNKLVDFSNDLDDEMFKINIEISIGNTDIKEEDIMNVVNVLNKYRKDN